MQRTIPEEMETRLLRAAEVFAAKGYDESRMEDLVDVVRAQLEILDQNPDLSIVPVAHFGRAGRLPDLADAVDAAFHEPVRALLEEARDVGASFLDDLEIMTVALFGAVLILGVHYLVAGRSIPVDRATDDLARMITRGLTR